MISPEVLKEIVSLIKNDKLLFEYGYADHKSTKEKRDSYVFVAGGLSTLKAGTIGIDPIGIATYKSFKIVKDNIVYIHGANNTPFYIIRQDDNLNLRKKLPLLNDASLLIHELVSKWAKHPLEETAQKIFKLTPAMYAKVDSQLYRGVTLSPPALSKLSKGMKVTLEDRKFSSWSEDISLASTFIRNNGAIMKHVGPLEVVININLFEQSVFKSLEYYPRNNEKEYILHNTPDILVVHPLQVFYYRESQHKFLKYDDFVKDFKKNEKLYASVSKVKIEYVDPDNYNYEQLKEAENVVKDSGLRMLRNDEIYCLALSGKKVVGVLYYSFDNEELRISIAVDEKYRQKGIAKQLFEKVETIPEYDYVKVIIGELVPPYTLEGLLKKNKYKYASTEGTFKIYKKRIKK